MEESLQPSSRPISYAAIVASTANIVSTACIVSTPESPKNSDKKSEIKIETHQNQSKPQLAQDPQSQSNTLPRSNRRGGGGYYGRGQYRQRTYSGSYTEGRPNRGGFNNQRGRGFSRGGNSAGYSQERPQYQGGIRRDNPQYHTFPRSRRRQAPDPEKYEQSATTRGTSSMGPSQRRIVNRKFQQQQHQHHNQLDSNPNGSEFYSESRQKSGPSFSEILRSKSSSSIPQECDAKPIPSSKPIIQQHEPSIERLIQPQIPPENNTTAKNYTRSYAFTLATGLDDLLMKKASITHTKKVIEASKQTSIYSSHPIITLEDPWNKGPPPLIPGLRFRSSQPLERRNSKKLKQSQEQIQTFDTDKKSNEANECSSGETQTLRRRRSRKKRIPQQRSKSAGDADHPDMKFNTLNQSMKDDPEDSVTIKEGKDLRMETQTTDTSKIEEGIPPTTLKRRRSRRKRNPEKRSKSSEDVKRIQTAPDISTQSQIDLSPNNELLAEDSLLELRENPTLKRRRSRRKRVPGKRSSSSGDIDQFKDENHPISQKVDSTEKCQEPSSINQVSNSIIKPSRRRRSKKYEQNENESLISEIKIKAKTKVVEDQPLDKQLLHTADPKVVPKSPQNAIRKLLREMKNKEKKIPEKTSDTEKNVKEEPGNNYLIDGNKLTDEAVKIENINPKDEVKTKSTFFKNVKQPNEIKISIEKDTFNQAQINNNKLTESKKEKSSPKKNILNQVKNKLGEAIATFKVDIISKDDDKNKLENISNEKFNSGNLIAEKLDRTVLLLNQNSNKEKQHDIKMAFNETAQEMEVINDEDKYNQDLPIHISESIEKSAFDICLQADAPIIFSTQSSIVDLHAQESQIQNVEGSSSIFLETGSIQIVSQSDAPVILDESLILPQDSNCEEIISISEDQEESNIAERCLISVTETNIQDEKPSSWAQITAACLDKEMQNKDDLTLNQEENSDIEIMQAPALIVEVIESVPIMTKDVDVDGFQKVLTKKQIRERKESLLAEEIESTSIDIVEDILNVDIERTKEVVQKSKLVTMDLLESSDDDFIIIPEDPNTKEGTKCVKQFGLESKPDSEVIHTLPGDISEHEKLLIENIETFSHKFEFDNIIDKSCNENWDSENISMSKNSSTDETECNNIEEIKFQGANQTNLHEPIFKPHQVEESKILEKDRAIKEQVEENIKVTLSETVKPVNQTSSISSFDESQGINTGEEEVYWRIREKVKKKRRKPKQAVREGSTESESELNGEHLTLTSNIEHKIQSPIPENTSSRSSELGSVVIPENECSAIVPKHEFEASCVDADDEAAHGADIEDNVSIGKLTSATFESDDDDFENHNVTKEIVSASIANNHKTTWAFVASIPPRPTTPEPVHEVVHTEKVPLVIVKDDVDYKKVVTSEKGEFEVVIPKRNKRLSSRASEGDSDISDVKKVNPKLSILDLPTKNIFSPISSQFDEANENSNLKDQDYSTQSYIASERNWPEYQAIQASEDVLFRLSDKTSQKSTTSNQNENTSSNYNSVTQKELFQNKNDSYDSGIMDSQDSKIKEQSCDIGNLELSLEGTQTSPNAITSPTKQEKSWASILKKDTAKSESFIEKPKKPVNEQSTQPLIIVLESESSEATAPLKVDKEGFEVFTSKKEKRKQRNLSLSKTEDNGENCEISDKALGNFDQEKQKALGDDTLKNVSIPREDLNTNTKIIGLLERLSDLVISNSDKIEEAVTAAMEHDGETQSSISANTVEIPKYETLKAAVTNVEKDEEDSCPIEPFLNDSDEEQEQIPVDSIKLESTNVLILKNETAETDKIGKSVNELIQNEDEEDSCPIEPFLNDSDDEQEELPVDALKLESTNVLILKNETTETDKIGKSVTELLQKDDDEEDSCPIEPFLNDSDEEKEEIPVHAMKQESTNILILKNETTETDKIGKSVDDLIQKEDEEEDSCPIEPFLNDSDEEQEQIPVDTIKLESTNLLILKNEAAEIDKIGKSVTEVIQKEDEEEDSCPIEPFLNDSDEEQEEIPVDAMKLESTNILILKNETTETDKIGKSVDEVIQKEDEEEDSCPIEPFLNDSDIEQEEIPVVALKLESTNVLILKNETAETDKIGKSVTELIQKGDEEDSCPIEPFLNDSDDEQEELPVDALKLESTNVLILKNETTETDKISKPVTELIQKEDDEDDSCPIEPFLNDSDEEQEEIPVDALKLESTNVLILKNETTETDKIGKSVTELIQKEDEEEDSCPIEPFLNDSDEEQEEIPVDAMKQELTNLLILENETAETDKIGKSVNELIQKEDDEEDSCPIEPFLNDSDEEQEQIPVDSKKLESTNNLILKNEEEKTNNLNPEEIKFVDDDDDDSSCAIEPFMNDSDDEINTSNSISQTMAKLQVTVNSGFEGAISEKNENIFPNSESKSWAKVAAFPKQAVDFEPEPLKVQHPVVVPDVVVVVDMPKASVENIDLEGFKTVVSKKELKRTRTLSLKSIAETQTEIVKEETQEEHKDETEPSKEGIKNNKDVVDLKESSSGFITSSEIPSELVISSDEIVSWARVASTILPPKEEQSEIQLETQKIPLSCSLPHIVLAEEEEEEHLLKLNAHRKEDEEGFVTVLPKTSKNKPLKKSPKTSIENIHGLTMANQCDIISSQCSSCIDPSIVEFVNTLKADETSEPNHFEDNFEKKSWASIASVIPPLSNEVNEQDNKVDSGILRDIKIPEVVVIEEKTPDSAPKLENKIEDDFKVVHTKKDRKRTRTISQEVPNTPVADLEIPHKNENELQDAQTDADGQAVTVQPKVALANTSEERARDGNSQESNFQIDASKDLSVPVAEDSKPPDPFKILQLEKFWTNKTECETAELMWQLSLSKKTRRSSNKPERTTQHDDRSDKKDPEPGGKKDGGNNNGNTDREKAFGDSHKEFSSDDGPSHQQSGSGNWSDESTYLKLMSNPQGVNAESKSCDSGYNSLKRSNNSLEDVKLIDQEKLKASLETSKSMDELSDFEAQVAGVLNTFKSISSQDLTIQVQMTKVLSKYLSKVDEDVGKLSATVGKSQNLVDQLARIRSLVKDHLVKARSDSSRLVELWTEKRTRLRQYRDLLSDLEEFLFETQISISSSLTLFSTRTIQDDIRIVETLDEEIGALGNELTKFEQQCRMLAVVPEVCSQAALMQNQLSSLRWTLDNAQRSLHDKMSALGHPQLI